MNSRQDYRGRVLGAALLALALANCAQPEQQAPPPRGSRRRCDRSASVRARYPSGGPRQRVSKCPKCARRSAASCAGACSRKARACAPAKCFTRSIPARARADLADAQAAAASAHARLRSLAAASSASARVSRQAVEDARAAANQARRRRSPPRASIVGYTRVTAPISGVIGVSSVTPGALATPSQADALRRHPADRSRLCRHDAVERRRHARCGNRWRDARRASARAASRCRTASEYPIAGTLQFADVTVDPITGAVRLRALFHNPRQAAAARHVRASRPSASASIPTRSSSPQRGVTRNARGEATVLIVNQQNVVEERVIETGAHRGRPMGRAVGPHRRRARHRRRHRSASSPARPRPPLRPRRAPATAPAARAAAPQRSRETADAETDACRASSSTGRSSRG